jgi:magnesium-transporting ATPase (P-type)
MGISGTQIAKDAANIILLDDNFATIVVAAKWGRNVTECIQRFVQFQLTTNASILVMMLVTAFHPGEMEDGVRKKLDPPLTVLQMLWLNLIMDAFGAIALASEKPTDDMLERPPVNRSSSIITHRMWVNMAGQVAYQVLICLSFLFRPEVLPGCPENLKGFTGKGSEQYSIIFAAFTFMTIVNEYNCRKLRGEFNVFSGLFTNPTFMTVSAITSIVTVVMVEFLGAPMQMASEGLSRQQWSICMLAAFGGLAWQQFINFGEGAWKHKFVAHRTHAKKHTRFATHGHSWPPHKMHHMLAMTASTDSMKLPLMSV